MKNPLLSPPNTPFDTLPFNLITPEHFLPALEECIDMAKKEIDQITQQTPPPSFSNTIEALEKSGENIGKISRALFNLNSAETNPEMQNLAQKAAPILSAFQNDIRLNNKLFDRIKAVYDGPTDTLTNEQQTLLNKEYRSFVRNGALLNEEKKALLRDLDLRLAKLSLSFGENVLADTNAYQKHITQEKELIGIPKSVLTRAQQNAEAKGKKGWIFTLDYPCYVPVMSYAENRELRKEMRIAFGQRGFQSNEFNNEKIVLEITSLRKKRAQLLGYESHAAFVLEERMAKNEKTVLDFLDELTQKARPVAQKEWNEMIAFGQTLGIDKIEKWDTAFIAEKIKKEKYTFNADELKPFFSLPKVLEGLFTVVHRLFELNFEVNKEISTYHADVTSYTVTKNKEHIGVLYTDFFPREGKRDGAWMTVFRPQKKGQRPHISIVCNFSPPSETSPSLLTFNEVLTLFHEFGHALHGLLAHTQYASLSGTNVFWDFVELPSQLLENWCYQPEVLALFAQHYKTGEQLPHHFIEKIKQTEQFHQGLQTLRQLSFGYLDLAWHNTTADQIKTLKAHEKSIMDQLDWTADLPECSMSSSFSHIFQGGYAAGYYSYKWAEVLDADAFELFVEKGIFDKKTSQGLFEHILSKGGTEDPLTLYKRFRGKAPNTEALLKRAGLSLN